MRDMVYKCLECNEVEVTNDYRTDGRVCTKCGGHLAATGYAVDTDTKGNEKIVRDKAKDMECTWKIILKDRSPFTFTGDIILFNDSDTVQLARDNTIYINAEEVIYIMPVEEK